MQQESKIFASCRSDFIGQNPKLFFVIISLLFISAFSIRLYHITKPPLDFAPIRQYQTAHNARAYYYHTHKSVSEEQKEIAAINAERMGFTLEPRIMERLAVFGYRIAGEEKLWIPRVFSSLFWVVGGFFLFLAAKKIAGLNAAFFSAAFYLFLPYSILASRSFQPDPLMIMMLLASIYAIISHHEQPSWYRLLLASIASALAMLIKPYCIFLIFGVFISLSLKREGLRKTILGSKLLSFSFISLLPAFIYYGYSSLIQRDAQSHIQLSFLPYLLLRPYFWKDWLLIIGRVTGYVSFIASIAGIFMARGMLRTILTGLWVGYVLFGLIFNYHIHTHDYYQLQFIPIVALSLIPVAAVIVRKISSLSRKNIMLVTLVIIAVVASAGYIARGTNLKDYKNYIKPIGAFLGINPDFYQFITANYEKEIRAAQEIGEIIGHSTNTVFLTSDYGRSLSYHGELAGLPWPINISLRDRAEMGTPIPSKEELFNPRYLMIRTYKSDLFSTQKTYENYIRYTPDYFIITDLKEFETQPDLKEFLYNNFPVKAKNDSYIIFDMSKMSSPDQTTSSK